MHPSGLMVPHNNHVLEVQKVKELIKQNDPRQNNTYNCITDVFNVYIILRLQQVEVEPILISLYTAG